MKIFRKIQTENVDTSQFVGEIHVPAGTRDDPIEIDDEDFDLLDFLDVEEEAEVQANQPSTSGSSNPHPIKQEPKDDYPVANALPLKAAIKQEFADPDYGDGIQAGTSSESSPALGGEQSSSSRSQSPTDVTPIVEKVVSGKESLEEKTQQWIIGNVDEWSKNMTDQQLGKLVHHLMKKQDQRREVTRSWQEEKVLYVKTVFDQQVFVLSSEEGLRAAKEHLNSFEKVFDGSKAREVEKLVPQIPEVAFPQNLDVRIEDELHEENETEAEEELHQDAASQTEPPLQHVVVSIETQTDEQDTPVAVIVVEAENDVLETPQEVRACHPIKEEFVTPCLSLEASLFSQGPFTVQSPPPRVPVLPPAHKSSKGGSTSRRMKREQESVQPPRSGLSPQKKPKIEVPEQFRGRLEFPSQDSDDDVDEKFMTRRRSTHGGRFQQHHRSQQPRTYEEQRHSNSLLGIRGVFFPR